jgi:hypothetical protein
LNLRSRMVSSDESEPAPQEESRLSFTGSLNASFSIPLLPPLLLLLMPVRALVADVDVGILLAVAAELLLLLAVAAEAAEAAVVVAVFAAVDCVLLDVAFAAAVEETAPIGGPASETGVGATEREGALDEAASAAATFLPPLLLFAAVVAAAALVRLGTNPNGELSVVAVCAGKALGSVLCAARVPPLIPPSLPLPAGKGTGALLALGAVG